MTGSKSMGVVTVLKIRTGEMAQRLRALAVLEVLSSIANRMAAPNHLS